MRRHLLAALCACLLLAVPAHAAQRPATVPDATGDWPVASGDLAGMRLYGVTVDGVRALRADVTFAGVPAAGTTFRAVVETKACGWWSLSVNRYGTPLQNAALERYGCDLTALGGPVESSPATFTVTGKTVRITAPYALGLRRGARLVHGAATASVQYTGVIVYVPPAKSAETGDYAGNGIDYVLP